MGNDNTSNDPDIVLATSDGKLRPIKEGELEPKPPARKSKLIKNSGCPVGGPDHFDDHTCLTIKYMELSFKTKRLSSACKDERILKRQALLCKFDCNLCTKCKQ